jgi:hypothetical protein
MHGKSVLLVLMLIGIVGPLGIILPKVMHCCCPVNSEPCFQCLLQFSEAFLAGKINSVVIGYLFQIFVRLSCVKCRLAL